MHGTGTPARRVSVTYADSQNIDSFGRLRVSTPTQLISLQNQYDADPIKLESGTTGTGVAPAHNALTRMLALSATAGSGTSWIQSYEYATYIPDRSHRIEATGVFGTAVAGAVVDIGYFDSKNGIFFRQNGTSGYEFVRRTYTGGSVFDEVVPQADWNTDKFNGSGSSGITYNFTKCFILFIDLQYLGMGSIRVGFNYDGCTYIVHEFRHAGVLSVPYMQSATLPIQMLLTATDTADTKTAYFKCAAVVTEGGDPDVEPYSFSTPEGTVTAASGARTHILSLRPLTTFNAITNRTKLKLASIELTVTGSNQVYWELALGATFSVAPTYANVNSTYSASEYGTAGTYNTGGLIIASGYVAATASAKSTVSRSIIQNYPITLDRAGAVRAMGTLSLLVSGIGGTSNTRASFQILETR